MTQKVKGFLASDGKFFDTEPECLRYEYEITIRDLCESHNVNADNFFVLLREWSTPIKGYYYADAKCKDPIKSTGTVEFDGEIPFDTVPSPDEDREDTPVGDRDAPGFLEQQIRRG